MSNWRGLMIFIVSLFLAACASKPAKDVERPPSQSALPAQPDDVFFGIEKRIADQYGADASGFHLLDSNEAGLKWRLALIDSARHSIDLQYYLWYGDAAGKLLSQRLIDAADRGVRVRMIVDDINSMFSDAATIMQRDSRAALMDAHPNIEIRLFNPWKNRSIASRVGEMVVDLKRLNQRMHNKAMIVDNRAAIVGGRNIGDDYMGLHHAFNFHDLDVLGIGPIARQTSAIFDSFWNSAWVLPVAALGIETTAPEREQARSRLLEELASMHSLERFPVERQDWSGELAALSGRLHIGTSAVYSDVPTDSEIRHEMLEVVYRLASSAQSELLITNAYIIPADRGVKAMDDLSKRGVKIKVLTNSLASHDVPAVNSHYKRWRKPLLESGVELYETRHDAAIQPLVADTAPIKAEFMGLHVKALVVDRKRSYIGSMNLDPRSVGINSEMGAVIESPSLAKELAKQMERDMRPENAWQVQFDEHGKLRWVSGDTITTSQPARSQWQRIQDLFFMLFPADQY